MRRKDPGLDTITVEIYNKEVKRLNSEIIKSNEKIIVLQNELKDSKNNSQQNT